MRPSPAGERPAWTYEENSRRQVRRGLELTPAERLRWLEETVAELRSLMAQARESQERGSPGTPRTRS